MKELRVAIEARADLTEIEAHSREQWGDEQADAYLEAIGQRLHRISSRPAAGVNCSAVFPGLRRLSVGSHLIFYTEGEDFVLVIRVLHQRMNHHIHLRGLPEDDS